MVAEQATLDVAVPQGHSTHLTKDQLGDTPVRTPREFYCTACSCRVTQATDETGEYGHTRNCPHKYRGGDA